MNIEGVRNRITRDYFAGSRGKEYKEILQTALDNGYQIMSLKDFFSTYKEGSIDKDKKERKYFVCDMTLISSILRRQENFLI